MIKMSPLSPSSLKKYVDCPRAYQARYVTKEFRESYDSPPAKRGKEIHEILEQALNYPEREIKWGKHHGIADAANKALQKIARYREEGWTILVEHEAATDGNGRVCGWWDADCFMRAKIDVLLVSPDKSIVIIWDWKTGQKKSINPFQLTFIAQVLVPTYGVREYGAIDVLLDSSVALPETIHPGCALPRFAEPLQVTSDHGREVVIAIKDWMQAHVSDQWPERKGSHCSWCQFTECKFCKWKGA